MFPLTNIQTYATVFAAALLIGLYSGYSVTSDIFEGRIAKATLQAEKEKDAIERKGDQLVADHIKQIEKLSDNAAALQRQSNLANSVSCTAVDYGFVRVFNASTTAQTTTPNSLDGTTSTVDPATLLGVLIENNEKYLKLADQLTKLQQFVDTDQK